MRPFMIVPNDRKMTRREWLVLDHMVRTEGRKMFEETEAAAVDLMLYGPGEELMPASSARVLEWPARVTTQRYRVNKSGRT